MIYLKVNHRSDDSFSFKWLVPETLYKVENRRVPLKGPKWGTYNGTPKFYFDELSNVEVLLECRKQGIKIEDIKELK